MSFKRYKVGARIGKDLTVVSAFGTVRGRHPVYLAWDHRAWCPVVVKVFRSDARAEREYNVLMQAAHPNIVRPLGVYKPAIMLLEYLPGKTLQDYVEDDLWGVMPLSDAIRTIAHVASALHQVHRAGYVHLDVKPSNVMITNGVPKLFDFGTARRIGGERPPVVQGTDAYMAPEECSLGAVTPASDVYSLGVILHELLTGELPFPEGTSRNPHPQLKRAPRPLALPGGCPPGLQALVAACLALAPQDRPTIPALLTELHRYITEGPAMWPVSVVPGPVPAPMRDKGGRAAQAL